MHTKDSSSSCEKCGLRDRCGLSHELSKLCDEGRVFKINCPCQTCLVHIKCSEWCEDRKVYSRNTLFATFGEESSYIQFIADTIEDYLYGKNT